MIIVIGLVLNCKGSTDEIDTLPQSSEIESLEALIAAGRDDTKSDSIRILALKKAYEQNSQQQSDSIKLKYLSKIQWSFLNLSDSTWFRKTNKETNLLAQKMGDSSRIADSHWDLGVFHHNSNVNDSAYVNYFKAKKIYVAINSIKKAGRLEYDLASLQADAKNYTSAEVGVIRAIKILKPLEDYEMLYNCYNLLGIISKDLGEYDQSSTYYNTAKAYLNKSSYKGILETELENNIGVNYEEKGDFRKAIVSFKKVLSTDSLYFKNPESYARVLHNLASTQSKLNPNNTVSESLFLRSLKIRDSLGNQYDMAGGYYEFSSYYLEKKDSVKALSNALKAKMCAETSDNNERLLEALALLAQLDQKNASSYSARLVTLNDSLQRAERQTRNKFARIEFETEEVVAENELLTRQRQLWTGIAAALLLLALASFIIFTQRAKNQKLRFEQAQQKTNQEIMSLMLSQSEKIEAGKQKEQKRISEELHDGVQGRLQGSRMLLLGLNARSDEEAISERKKAIVVLKDIQEEVRAISHELSHAAYQKINNFILSIKELIISNGENETFEINFNFDDQFDWDALTGDMKINLYRIIQESIQNSIKHASCSTIDIDLSVENNTTKTTISDNGRGFVVKKGRKGIGMRNISSRVKKLNGTWEIDSQIGIGTTVTLLLPFHKNA